MRAFSKFCEVFMWLSIFTLNPIGFIAFAILMAWASEKADEREFKRLYTSS